MINDWFSLLFCDSDLSILLFGSDCLKGVVMLRCENLLMMVVIFVSGWISLLVNLLG